MLQGLLLLHDFASFGLSQKYEWYTRSTEKQNQNFQHLMEIDFCLCLLGVHHLYETKNSCYRIFHAQESILNFKCAEI